MIQRDSTILFAAHPCSLTEMEAELRSMWSHELGAVEQSNPN